MLFGIVESKKKMLLMLNVSQTLFIAVIETLHFMLLQAIIHYASVAANDVLGSCL